MFEKFTDRARRVIVLAQEESRLLNHNYIGTEHILLGLTNEGQGVAARALEAVGISLEKVREQVEETIGVGPSPPGGHIPFTARAKKVLELSMRESLQLDHNYIGTEHILLGLIREGEGVAAQVLVKLGADLTTVRREVIGLLSEHEGEEASSASSSGAVAFSFEDEMDVTGEEPACPTCHIKLARSLSHRRLDARAGDGSEPIPATVFYCGNCGRALGASPPA